MKKRNPIARYLHSKIFKTKTLPNKKKVKSKRKARTPVNIKED